MTFDSPPGRLAQQARQTIATLRARPGLADLWSAARAAGGELAERCAEFSRIPAPSFGEEARGNWVAGVLASATGQSVERDALGDRWVTLAGAAGPGPRVLVCAHLDTVFPPGTDCAVRCEGNRLRGPGIGDNASGLAVLLTAARLLSAAGRPFRGELLVAANVGEEGLGDLRGARALCEKFGGALDGFLSLDGGLGQVVGVAVGVRRYRVRVRGPGGHSWSAFGTPSAIHHLARVAAALASLGAPERPRTTFNIGVLRGGTSVNTIAAEADLELDLRSVDAAALAALDTRAQDAIRSVPAPPPLDVSVEPIGARPTGDPALARDWIDLARAAWEALGVPSKVTASSTDANAALAHGLRASTLGVCRGEGAHTLNEWIDADALPLGLEGALLVLLAALELFNCKGQG